MFIRSTDIARNNLFFDTYARCLTQTVKAFTIYQFSPSHPGVGLRPNLPIWLAPRSVATNLIDISDAFARLRRIASVEGDMRNVPYCLDQYSVYPNSVAEGTSLFYSRAMVIGCLAGDQKIKIRSIEVPSARLLAKISS